MMKEMPVVRRSAYRLAKASRAARDAYVDGRAGHEPEITDRMLGEIESFLGDPRIKATRPDALRTLSKELGVGSALWLRLDSETPE